MLCAGKTVLLARLNECMVRSGSGNSVGSGEQLLVIDKDRVSECLHTTDSHTPELVLLGEQRISGSTLQKKFTSNTRKLMIKMEATE
jgi:hypothetical protein